MDITNVVMPNLVSHEVAMIHVMASRSGYVYYRKFVTGSRKGFQYLSDGSQGGLERGEVLNGTFGLGKPQSQYTSRKVRLKGKIPANEETEAASIILKWCPVRQKTALVTIGSDEYIDAGDGTFLKNVDAVIDDGFDGRGYPIRRIVGGTAVASKDLNIVYGSTRDDHYHPENIAPNEIPRFAGCISGDLLTAGLDYVVTYEYENDYVPQNDIPLVSVTTEPITLFAKVRRVAINFSQLAAFESSTDHGVDLGKQLHDMAIAQLQYKQNCTFIA